MLLGMLVAVATVSGVGLNPFPPERGDVAVIALPLLVPLLVLAIPFLDVVLATVRRTRKGVGIMHADKEHIYHRLMDIGHGHRQTVLLMYLWSTLVWLRARDRGDRRLARRRRDRPWCGHALPRDGAAPSPGASAQRGCRERGGRGAAVGGSRRNRRNGCALVGRDHEARAGRGSRGGAP